MSRGSITTEELKARCLALLDWVARSGETLVVTKCGQPVAKIVPILPHASAALRGSVTLHGDVVGPIVDDWGAVT